MGQKLIISKIATSCFSSHLLRAAALGSPKVESQQGFRQQLLHHCQSRNLAQLLYGGWAIWLPSPVLEAGTTNYQHSFVQNLLVNLKQPALR